MTDNPVETVEIPVELAKDARSALIIAGEEFPQETFIRGEHMTFDDIAEWLESAIDRDKMSNEATVPIEPRFRPHSDLVFHISFPWNHECSFRRDSPVGHWNDRHSDGRRDHIRDDGRCIPVQKCVSKVVPRTGYERDVRHTRRSVLSSGQTPMSVKDPTGKDCRRTAMDEHNLFDEETDERPYDVPSDEHKAETGAVWGAEAIRQGDYEAAEIQLSNALQFLKRAMGKENELDRHTGRQQRGGEQ